MRWIDGTPMSGISKVFVFGLIILVFLAVTEGRAGLIFPIGFASIILGLFLKAADERRHRAGLNERSGGSAKKYPAAFKAPRAVKSSKELPHLDSFSIYDSETADCLGTLTYPQLKSLIEKHEGWGLKHNDFYIMTETITKLEEENADTELIEFLRKALGGRDAMEIRWVS